VNQVPITLHEWETKGPDDEPALAQRGLGDDSARQLADQLLDAGTLAVRERANGLQISARQFVGRISLGELNITIQPKLQGAPLVNLIRYAYGLRDLDRYEPVEHATEKWAFQELLVLQLAAEVTELLARGIHRDYKRTSADLENPRGRIEFNRLVGAGYWTGAALPCTHFPRAEDTPMNQAILAGSSYALRASADNRLRAKISRLVQTLSMTVSLKKLSFSILDEARQAIDRRTTTYEPALRIIQLLLQGEGISLDGEVQRLQLPGFLFDMNHFFQNLVSRFLHENLDGCNVQDQYRLKEVFEYVPSLNPRNRHAPAIRPDFVLWSDRRIAAVLDAKYRDLWQEDVPADMLYQLALYALSRQGTDRESAIIYPVLASNASEQAIHLRHPVSGDRQARVILRPLDLHKLESLVRSGDRRSLVERKTLAHRLAFGDR
jgi:5-methylcytosine-specific restriction enzyme subunit McrC